MTEHIKPYVKISIEISNELSEVSHTFKIIPDHSFDNIKCIASMIVDIIKCCGYSESRVLLELVNMYNMEFDLPEGLTFNTKDTNKDAKSL